jgi:hypothetical protein
VLDTIKLEAWAMLRFVRRELAAPAYVAHDGTCGSG